MGNGEITKEPLKVIYTDVLVTYVMYDHENDHLENLVGSTQGHMSKLLALKGEMGTPYGEMLPP
jgi:hypothetical protein